MGLAIMLKNGYRDVKSGDGVVYCGEQVEEEDIPVLESLGWDYDEDFCMWYFLVERVRKS